MENALEGRQIEAFLPTYPQRSQWSDRVKVIERPLIPGYIFVRLPETELARVKYLAGVFDVLPNAFMPESIPDDEINSLRLAACARAGVSPCAYKIGEKVRVRSGPLAGLTGVVERTKSSTAIIVSVELLKRAVRAEIDPDNLEK